MSREIWTCPEDRFPVLEDRGYGNRKLTVPLALVAEHERQAKSNHGQSVARLKERGGLAWCELAAVLGNRRWERMDSDRAHETAMRHVLVWQDRQRRALKATTEPQAGLSGDEGEAEVDQTLPRDGEKA